MDEIKSLISEKIYCEKCNEYVEYDLIDKNINFEIDNDIVVLQKLVPICPKCNSIFLPDKLYNKYEKEAYKQHALFK